MYKNAIIILITAFAKGMDQQTIIRKWTCLFCRTMKSGSGLDWMCLSCDDLICLGCFGSWKPFLQSSNKCPSSGHQLPPSFTEFTWLATHQQAAHDNENKEDN